MAKKQIFDYETYDFTTNPGGYTFEELVTIRRMHANGEAIFLAPIKVEFREQLESLHTDFAHCKTWYIGAEAVTVKLTPVSEPLYDFMVNTLRTEHRDGVRKSRCLVRGKRGKLVRCDEKNRCAECPYGYKPEDRQYQEVSWDELSDKGVDPAAADTTSAPVLFEMGVEVARAQMAAEDGRLLTIYEMLEDKQGVPEIMDALKLSQRRVYQMIARCREIVKTNL